MDRLRKAGTNKVGDQAPADEDHELPLGSPDIWGNGNNGFVQPSIGVQGVKLNAAHRLMASDKAQALRNLVGTLNGPQKDYFFRGLPTALGLWFYGEYKTKLQTPDVVLSSQEVQAALGLDEFKRFIIGMSYIRTVFPPKITSGSIYRLTAISKLPEGPLVKFKPEEQFRSLTSWTVRKKPIISGRKAIGGLSDIILEHELSGGKNVLFDYLSIQEFFSTLVDDWDFYKGRILRYWENAEGKVKAFRAEKEVAIYVNAGSELDCTWRKV